MPLEPYNRDRPGSWAPFVLAEYRPGAAGGPSAFIEKFPGQFSWVNTFAGERNPSWKSQVRRQLQAGTNLTCRFTSMNDQPVWGYWYRSRNGGVDKASLLMNCPQAVPSLVHSALAPNPAVYNRALGRFYNEVYDALTPVKGGVILGNMKKTLHDLRHPLQSMRTLLNQYLSANLLGKRIPGIRKYKGQKLRFVAPRASLLHPRLGGLARTSSGQAVMRQPGLDALASSYLETVYGWEPLARDVDSILRYATDEAAKLGLQEIIVKGKAHEEACDSFPPATARYTADLAVAVSVTGRSDYRLNRVKYRGAVNVTVGVDLARHIQEDLGFGLVKDFVPNFYQLVPYSFLLDYFTNVGNIVYALCTPRAKISWVIETAVSTRRYSYVSTPIGGSLDPSVWNLRAEGGPAYSAITDVLITRKPFSSGQSLPIPDLEIHVPSLTAGLKSLVLLLQYARSKSSSTRV